MRHVVIVGNYSGVRGWREAGRLVSKYRTKAQHGGYPDPDLLMIRKLTPGKTPPAPGEAMGGEVAKPATRGCGFSGIL